MDTTALPVKATHGATKRRFTIPRGATLLQVQDQLRSVFQLSFDPIFAYLDDDGDRITVSTGHELAEMFRVASAAGLQTLRLELISSRPAPAPTPAFHTAAEDAARQASDARADAAEAQQFAQEEIRRGGDSAAASVNAAMSGLAAFLTAFGSSMPQPPPPPPPPPHPFPMFQQPYFGRQRRSRRQPMPDLSALGPLLASLAPLAAAFRGAQTDSQNAPRGGAQTAPQTAPRTGMCDVSAATRTAFAALRDAVMESSNRDAILNAARQVFPSVREWAIANLRGTNAIPAEVVDQLCNTISDIIRPSAGEEVSRLTSNLVRAGLADDAVRQILQHVPWQAPFEWDAEFRIPVPPHRGPAGFDVHRRIECNICGKGPIVGMRYKATNRTDYDLCSKCYNNPDVNKEGIEFTELKYVWQASCPDAVVPPSPLVLGDRGPTVAFLQKVLTDLGYMNSSMYRRRVGMYGPNTREAVLQFQREYGLQSVAETGMYDATTAASLSSVLESSTPPTTSTGGAPDRNAPAGETAGPSTTAPPPAPPAES